MHSAMHFYVSGLVQGVGFRYSTVRQARLLGLCGWVRNLQDGRVEVWAEGDVMALARLGEWLKQGPPAARVGQLLVEEATATGCSEFIERSTV